MLEEVARALAAAAAARAPVGAAAAPSVVSVVSRRSAHDHGTRLVVAGDAVWTHLDGCYPGSGRAEPQRDVRVDAGTGALTTLAWLEARAPQQVVVDGWRVAEVTGFVPAR